MADVKISALPAASTPLAGTEVLPIVQGGTTDKVSVADLTAGRAVNTGDLTADGNLNITGTARRITGDFSNATPSNRVSFQSSTTNGGTALTVIPNGTSTTTNLLLYNAADPTNASIMQVRSSGDGGLHGIQSTTSGSGTLLPINFFIGGGERMRITTGGLVGIGVSAPGSNLDVAASGTVTAGNVVRVFNSTDGVSAGALGLVKFGSTATTYGPYTANTVGVNSAFTNLLFGTETAHNAIFYTNNTERMRIDASGNVGIGTSSPAWRFTAVGGSTQISPGTSAQEGVRFTRSTGVCAINGINNDNNAYNALSFATGASEAMRITTGGEVYIAGTTDQGAYNLQVNGTGVWGAGAYVNGSDARIKDDIAPLASGLDVVAKLKPVQFRYKESWSKDTSLQPGFIAQDLQAALVDQPYVDGVVLQGPEYMSVAYQSLIPLLTKAIQELKADNDALKARVAALENK